MKKLLSRLTLAAGIMTGTACDDSTNSQSETNQSIESYSDAVDPVQDNIQTISGSVAENIEVEINYETLRDEYKRLIDEIGINPNQRVTVFELEDLPLEHREIAMNLLRRASSFAQLDSDLLINFDVYQRKIDWIRNWINAVSEENHPVNRYLNTSELVEDFRQRPEDFRVDQARFLETSISASRFMHENFPVAQLTSSLRQFLEFNPEMIIALTIEEHSDPTYVATRGENRDNRITLSPAQRIELLRLYLNSGFNPFLVIPNRGSNLPFGVLQNTPSSTNFNDLSAIWNSENFSPHRSSDLTDPFLNKSFSDMFGANTDAYNLQIVVALTKILNRIHEESRRAYFGEERERYLAFVEMLRNNSPEENDRFGLVIAALVQASSIGTSNRIIGPVVVSGARSAQEAIDMILSSEVLNQNQVLNRYVRHALEAYDLLKSGDTGFGAIGQ
jgi:hypothetical protein